ncbi:MAG: hypothetical protein AB8B87_07180 [Granulosicoccus sp.]
MGKTYKTQPEDHYLDDLFEDDYGLDADIDDNLEPFLDSQSSDTTRHTKRGYDRKKTTAYDEDYSRNRLPQDWQDFDFAPDSYLGDDWS